MKSDTINVFYKEGVLMVRSVQSTWNYPDVRVTEKNVIYPPALSPRHNCVHIQQMYQIHTSLSKMFLGEAGI